MVKKNNVTGSLRTKINNNNKQTYSKRITQLSFHITYQTYTLLWRKLYQRNITMNFVPIKGGLIGVFGSFFYSIVQVHISLRSQTDSQPLSIKLQLSTEC